MFLLLLLLTTAQANGLSDRSPRPDTGPQIPPGVEVLGYDIGTVPIDCLREGAQITRIKYSDGSIWQHP